jgi:beta propeller repeat protein
VIKNSANYFLKEIMLMNKKGAKKYLNILIIISLFVIISTSFVSAGLLNDINNYLKHFFGIGNNNDLRGQLYESPVFQSSTPTTVPVYRFYNNNNGAHFYTISEAERDNLIANYSYALTLEGIAFYVYATQATDTLPVYRFYNNNNGAHFYTISEAERDNLIANYPTIFTLEGIAFYVYATKATDTLPVYRFYNNNNSAHFYTISEAEKNYVIANYPSIYVFEGAVFYAYASNTSTFKNCSDGTNYNSCSITKPKYCSNGSLINNCSYCGCLANYSCQVDGSCKAVACTNDTGCTSVGSFCSGNMPYTCTLGSDKCLDRINKSICRSGYICSSGSCQANTTQPQQNKLISYWKFDGNANDAVGTNNGTVYGAVLTTGISGQAYSFDGVNDYIKISSFNLTNEGSISFWFYATNLTGNSPNILFKKNDKLTTFRFYRNSGWYSGALGWLLYYENLSGATNNALPITDHNANQWYHVVFVYNSSGYYWAYVNGTNRLNSQVSNFKNWLVGNGDMYLGGAFTSSYFNGKLDEVKIWNYALNATEIKNEYDAVKPSVKNCSDGTFYGACSASKPKYCSNGTLIDSCSSCGCPSGYTCQGDGSCKIIISGNQKDMKKYSAKEVFLISDTNWKDVLQLVPLTTWTGSESCKKGTGTPNDVCVYPTLIYHAEAGEICNNGKDDNNDGLIDCCDPYCKGSTYCKEICNDGKDNDCDSYTDCKDSECASNFACIESNCTDGIDNDNDGYIDCKDSDCKSNKACIESNCTDGIDNDNDGLVDCKDPDCASNSACRELICNDGIDNDKDGYTDCADTDCTNDVFCGPDIYMYDLLTQKKSQITFNYTQYRPSISGNKIVWEDYRGRSYDIYLYDLDTKTEKQITNDSYGQYDPSISGNKIVWGDYRNYNSNIYMYDLDTKTEKRITNNSYGQYGPSISGNKIVWEDYRNSNSDIYMYDLDTKTEKQITNDTYSQYNPSISGNKIVWEDNRNSNYDIYMYDLDTKTEKQITNNTRSQYRPSISGNKIVWYDYRNGNSDIYMYDLDTKTEKQITNDTYYQYNPVISGNKIVWSGYRPGNFDIYIYDLDTKTEKQITNNLDCYNPSISGNKIVWYDYTIEQRLQSNLSDLKFSDVDKYSLSDATYTPTLEPINGKNLIRVSTIGKNRNFLYKFDIAAASEKNIDLIATEREIEEIRRNGYGVEILPLNNFNFAKYSIDACIPPGCIGQVYHNYSTMKVELESIQSNYPNISKIYDIGDSVEGRNIYAIKISDNPSTEEASEKEILIIGNHHAREIMTVEVPLYFADYLTKNYNSNPEIKKLVDNAEIWIIPTANPDGRDYVDSNDIMWRKNRRNNGNGSYGVDLNRNYGYKWGYDNIGSSPDPFDEIYRGTSAFSEPETQAIRNLEKAHNFTYVINYHAYGGDLLIPWRYIAQNTPDHSLYLELGSKMLENLPSFYAISSNTLGYGYPSNGHEADFEYGDTSKNKIIAFEFEINSDSEGGFRPPVSLILPTCQQQLNTFMFMLYNMTGIPQPEVVANNFDADSIIYFMQQYGAEKATIVGQTPQELDNLLIASPELGAGLQLNNTKRIASDQYLSYWKNFDTVVYSEDNYELALLASEYASLINSPLIIKGSGLDIDSNFYSRNIICVGSVIRSCNKTYSLAELEKAYFNLTKTDKLILTNPEDLSISQSENFNTEKGSPIKSIYSKTSLASPFLASAKKELIITKRINGSNSESESQSKFAGVDLFMNDKLLNYPNAKYLTVIGSHKAIPYSYSCGMIAGYGGVCVADWKYGALNNSVPGLETGRILGITLSDVSSYIARSIFYKDILNRTIPDGEGKIITVGHARPNYARHSEVIKQIADTKGYITACHMDISGVNCDTNIAPPFSDYDKVRLFTFADHGNTNTLASTLTVPQIPYFDLTFLISKACLPIDIWNGQGQTFGPYVIRKGAIGYSGGIVSTLSIMGNCSNNMAVMCRSEGECYLNGVQGKCLSTNMPGQNAFNVILKNNNSVTLGSLYKDLLNDPGLDQKQSESYAYRYKEVNILLGDPTLVSIFKGK